MRFDAGTRTRLLVDMELDFDPADATIEVKVDSTWYPATWLDAPTQKQGKWTRRARTDSYFAGPEAVASGATVLTASRHLTQTRITSGSDVLVADSSPLDVN